MPWGGKNIPGYIQDRYGHIYKNDSVIHQIMKPATPESPNRMQAKSATVTLLGK